LHAGCQLLTGSSTRKFEAKEDFSTKEEPHHFQDYPRLSFVLRFFGAFSNRKRGRFETLHDDATIRKLPKRRSIFHKKVTQSKLSRLFGQDPRFRDSQGLFTPKGHFSTQVSQSFPRMTKAKMQIDPRGRTFARKFEIPG
jgi:hypothetical protein